MTPTIVQKAIIKALQKKAEAEYEKASANFFIHTNHPTTAGEPGSDVVESAWKHLVQMANAVTILQQITLMSKPYQIVEDEE